MDRGHRPADPSDREDCERLKTFANQLLDQRLHAPVVSVAVYEEPPPLKPSNSDGPPAIVAFTLLDADVRSFYVSCGAGPAKSLCFDMRPLEPGEWTEWKLSHPNPVNVP